jgi:hypothetical protein
VATANAKYDPQFAINHIKLAMSHGAVKQQVGADLIKQIEAAPDAATVKQLVDSAIAFVIGRREEKPTGAEGRRLHRTRSDEVADQ